MEAPRTENKRNKGKLREFFSFGEVGNYFFRKKDPSRPSNFNIRVMHGINRLSIIVFLIGLLYLIIRHLL